MKQNKIGRVLCTGMALRKRHPNDFEYLMLDLDDDPSEDVYSHF